MASPFRPASRLLVALGALLFCVALASCSWDPPAVRDDGAWDGGDIAAQQAADAAAGAAGADAAAAEGASGAGADANAGDASQPSGSGAEGSAANAAGSAAGSKSASAGAAGKKGHVGGASPSAPAAGAGAGASGASSPSQSDGLIGVVISVDCSRLTSADPELASKVSSQGVMLAPKELRLPKEASVHDALKASGIPFTGSAYISSIGGLAEKQCGGLSGWMYAVNGVFPAKSVMACKLRDGDLVGFYYTLDGRPPRPAVAGS